MVDWRTTRGENLTPGERQWLHDVSAVCAEHSEDLTIVHIGVMYGGSLHCCRAGAPEARIVGVDLDTGKCLDPETFDLIEGNSGCVYYDFHDRIDLLFVDGDHTLEGVKIDIGCWAGKVRPGGIIAFHDYTDVRVPGVKEAVDEWHWSPTTWEPIEGVDSICAYRRLPYLRRGDPFGTVAIGVPYYKASYEFFRWWSWLLVGGLEPGDRLLNSMRVRGEMPIPIAHNDLVIEFLRTDSDTLCIAEDDHVGPQDVLRAMRAKRENWDFDIVCASYVNRTPRAGATVAVGFWILPEEDGGLRNDYGEYSVTMKPLETLETGTQEVDGSALGLVLIRRWVLEAMRGDRAPDEAHFFDWRGRNSLDIHFYGKLKEMGGVRCGVDRDNDIGHIGKKIYTVNDFYKKRDDYLVEVAKNG